VSSAIPCPVCGGPIGVHVVRPELTCHHCAWALRANVGSAFVRGLVAALVVAVLLLALIVFLRSSVAIWAWGEAVGVIALAAGLYSYRRILVLTPVRPQRNLENNQGHEQGAL
jgi:hypothetical protein